MRRVLISLVTILVCCVCLRAQDPDASVSGRVLDPSGGIVPGTQVTVVNDATNVAYSAVTNEAGIYYVQSLPPGKYHIQVSKNGFKNIIKPNVTLHVQDAPTINFTLEVGAASESVTVEGGAPLINTESTAVGTVVDRQFAENLPLNGRSFNTLLQLTPGVVITSTNVTSPGQFTISGQRTNANYFEVDGVSANFGIGSVNFQGTFEGGGGGAQAFNAYGGTSSLASVDALQEFRVETSSFAPEYGHTPGGQVIIETRSGTNNFHGDIFDYFRNTVLDANNWFSNLQGLPRTPEHQNDFGATFGGPLLHSKTFFFVSYEGLRLLQPQTDVGPVLSQAARTAASAAASPYISAEPQPNGPLVHNNCTVDGTTNGSPCAAEFTGAYDNRVTSNAASVRVDHGLNSRWNIFGRYNYAPSQIATRSHDTLSELDTAMLNTTTATVGATGKLGARWTDSFRANYSVQNGVSTSKVDSFGSATPIDPGLLLPSPLSIKSGNGSFIFAGMGGYGIGKNYGIHESQVNLIDGLTYGIATHEIKFGIDYRQLHYWSDANPGTINWFLLQSELPGFLSTAVEPGFDATYTLGNKAKIKLPNLDFYVQDIFKIRPRLTLTYGLRWEFNPAPSALDGTTLTAWENVSNPQATVLAPPGAPLWMNVYHNFGPRIGLAYGVTSDGSFVVRGGWGLFYDLGTGVVANLATGFPNRGIAFPVPPIQLPAANVTQYAPTLSSQAPYSSFQIQGFSNSLQSPRSYQWNAALEKSFGGQQAISVTYVGQVGRDLLRSQAELQPNANFQPGSVFFPTTNADTSSYNALQLQFRRPVLRRVQALVNYTLSHCIDTNSSSANVVPAGGVLPAQGDQGACDFDVRHNFTGGATFSLPDATHQRFLAEIVNHWSLDGVVQARSGFPINVTYQNFTFPGLVQGIPLRPDPIQGQSIWLSGSQFPGGKALNPAAFDSTTPMNANRQGNLGRNAITGFGTTQVDLSLMRKIPFTEVINLQFRADVFNVLNHPNFFNPDSNITDGSPLFGVSSQTLNTGLGGLSPLYQIGGPRSIQLSLKLLF